MLWNSGLWQHPVVGKRSIVDCLCLCNGWNPALRMQLATCDDALRLERFISHSIRTASCMQRCTGATFHSHNPFFLHWPESPSSEMEPIQLDSTCLLLSEHHRRLTQWLCLYCGVSGHTIIGCPIHPPCNLLSVVQPTATHILPLSPCLISLLQPQLSLTVGQPATLSPHGSKPDPKGFPGSLHSWTSTKSFLHSIHGWTHHSDSGSAPLEEINLLVLENSTADIILGQPWLMLHHPELSWGTGEVMRWSDNIYH